MLVLGLKLEKFGGLVMNMALLLLRLLVSTSSVKNNRMLLVECSAEHKKRETTELDLRELIEHFGTDSSDCIGQK